MPVGNPQLRRLRARFEDFLSGRAPNDPLYLTNRPLKQKLKIAALVAVPIVILLVLVLIAATDGFRLRRVDPYEHPAAEAQTSTAPGPRLPDPKLAAELEVVNIRIVRDARSPLVTGVVRNNTNAKVGAAEVSYYLADKDGSMVGTDTTEVTNVAAHGSVTFRVPLKIARAQYVLVRDVHPN
jgi:hypothetical protein